MVARMNYLKNDGLLYHSVEIRKLRRAIDAKDAYDAAVLLQRQKEWQERQERSRKKKKVNLFWRVFNWL